MSFKVTDFGTNRKPIYDFLLVINSNLGLPPILHRFGYVAFDKSKIAIFGYLSCGGGRRHLGILKFRNFNGRNGQEGETVSLCQISWRSVQPSPRYGNFSIFGRPFV